MINQKYYPAMGYGSGDFCAEVSEAVDRFRQFSQSYDKGHHPETTGERLKNAMIRAGWNAAIFTHRTQLRRSIFARIKRDPKANYSLNTCLSIAVGLGLTYRETVEILSLSGMGFDNGCADHNIYAYILSHYPGCSMEFFNAVCENAGAAVLGSAEYRDKNANWS